MSVFPVTLTGCPKLGDESTVEPSGCWRLTSAPSSCWCLARALLLRYPMEEAGRQAKKRVREGEGGPSPRLLKTFHCSHEPTPVTLIHVWGWSPQDLDAAALGIKEHTFLPIISSWPELSHLCAAGGIWQMPLLCQGERRTQPLRSPACLSHTHAAPAVPRPPKPASLSFGSEHSLLWWSRYWARCCGCYTHTNQPPVQTSPQPRH